MKVKDLKGKSKCDNGHVFESKMVKLEPWATNIKIFGAVFTFVDKDNIIQQGMDPGKTDFCLCCPVCNMSHPFGMDAVIEEKNG